MGPSAWDDHNMTRESVGVCMHVLCSVFNIGSECFAPVAAGRPSGVLQLRRDPEARRSGREESVLLTVISTGLLIHW